MNIESKKYKIVSTGFGGFTVTNKSTGESKYVSSVPSSGTLAAMHEREFDKAMKELMG